MARYQGKYSHFECTSTQTQLPKMISNGYFINFRVKGTKVAPRKTSDACVGMARMVTRHGKNHAAGHSRAHLGHQLMLTLSDVPQKNLRLPRPPQQPPQRPRLQRQPRLRQQSQVTGNH